MRKHWAALVGGVSLFGVMGAPLAHADTGPWEVRVRAVYLDPANQSEAIPSLAVPANAIHINSKLLPDVDLEYFFSPNWSGELVLTYPQTQTVTVEKSALGGPMAIGTFKHLPPFLTVKYNFRPGQGFQPYLGVGMNLTLISNVDLLIPTTPGIPVTLSSSSVGIAAQAGFDYKVADHWYVNTDIKWANLSSGVFAGGAKVSKVNINPFLFGIGVGHRF
jgi:outer membrane protein